MSSPFARLPHLALIVYVLALLAVVFQPQPELAVGSVHTVRDVFEALGAPSFLLAGARVEFFMNTVLFVPVAFLGALVFPRVRWSEWVVIAFVSSGLIEVAQGLVLSDRSAQFADVVSNTLGGLIGAAAAAYPKLMIRLDEQRGKTQGSRATSP